MQRNINREYLPYAIANINGSQKYTKIKGKVHLYSVKNGTLFKIEVIGLPNENKNNFFGFHIHQGEECNSQEIAFESALEHFNLENDEHPNHLGDLPMIYSNDGYAYMQFYTNRFTPDKVLEKTIIIHKDMDDFMTEPAGNSGERIACGKIIKYL